MTATGWKCPECGLILAPSVTEHRCDPPSAGIAAPVITPFEPPSTSTTVTWTPPPGTIVTVTNAGMSLSQAQVTELAGAVQKRLLDQARRNRRYPGSAA